LAWKQNLRHLAPAAVLALVGTASVAAASLAPTGNVGAPVGVLVIGADTARIAGIIAHADGRLVATGGVPGALIAVSDRADFVDRLYQAGASYVFRADGAVGCTDILRTGRS
jgi:hypothetical protein